MGCYVNPKGEKNYEWLEKNARLIGELDKMEVPVYKGLCTNGRLPVILVNNGSWYAAGVCFDEQEYLRFTVPDDPRSRIIYTCDKELLKQNVDMPERIQ